MKKPILNIGILLLIIIVLPPLFFTSYEIGNFYRNEQMIDSIYTSQLESVIFSINQFSDDVVSGWANQMEREIQKSAENEEAVMASFLQRNLSIETVFLADSLSITRIKTMDTSGTTDFTQIDMYKEVMEFNAPTALRLNQYLLADYRKIEPIDLQQPDVSLFLFAFRDADNRPRICGIAVNTTKFIAENLGPKIQSVAQDKFFLSVFETSSGSEVYSNELYENPDKNIEHKKPLWLMPDYQLGIQLKGETIEDMVQRRMRSNIWLIAIMDSLLILAAYFVYRGVRQQMKLAQLKSEFVSNVSHEIRTPLAIINMYSETLEMGRVKDKEKRQEYYRIIHTETNRLSGIVNKILNFSKIENGKRDFRLESTDLNQLVGQLLENYQHHFSTNGIQCKFDPSEDLPWVQTDRDAVTDALINLVDNAIKYGGDKKQIDILTGRNTYYVFVEVKDYGVGIEEKYQAMVFDKFYRVTQGDLAHQAKGSGIGLSIVKHIMTAHHGSVGLVSKPGEGSRFRLNFPV